MMNSVVRGKVDFFSRGVRERLGDNVRRIILFGSRARGDAWEGSDYDFVVVVANKDKNVRKAVRGAAVDFLNSYDEPAVSLVYSEEEWRRKKDFPIGINIEREGMAV